MAVTSPQSNNVALKFRGKPEQERPRMPVESKAQNAAMQAAAQGKSTLDIPKKVGEEFTADQKPGDVKKLPARKTSKADRLRARGLISDKQAEKLGEK